MEVIATERVIERHVTDYKFVVEGPTVFVTCFIFVTVLVWAIIATCFAARGSAAAKGG